jgi:hypothetical protein
MYRIAVGKKDDTGFRGMLCVYSQDAITAIRTEQLKKFRQVKKAQIAG